MERQKKRKRRFQLQVERLNEFLKDREPKRGSNGQEIQSNIIHNESVKMPSSHGVVQGYNAQALVDSKHQVILAAEAFATQDHENLAPRLKDAKKNLAAIGKEETYFQGKQLTADSNYHSLNSLTLCRDEKIDAYIGRQRPAAKPSPFTASDFSFDPTKQVYRCPQGKELTCRARNQTNRYRTYDVYHARLEDCAACPVRARCLSKPTSSRRYLSVPVDTQQPNLIDEMKAKIDSPQGKQIYARRLGTLAPHAVQVLSSRSLPTSVCRSA